MLSVSLFVIVCAVCLCDVSMSVNMISMKLGVFITHHPPPPVTAGRLVLFCVLPWICLSVFPSAKMVQCASS